MSNTNQVSAGQSSPAAAAPAAGLGPVPQVGSPTIALSPERELEKAHEEFALFQEGYVRSYIALADAKATMIFGAGAGMITYLFSQDGFREALLSVSGDTAFFLRLIAVVFLALTVVCAALVIVPRLRQTGEGLIFFGAVSAYPSASRYLEHVAGLTATELTAARIKHCYDVSKACVRKYDMLHRSFVFGGLALIATLAVINGL